MSSLVEEPSDVDVELADRLRIALTRLGRRLRRDAPGELTQSQWSALMTIEEQQRLRIGDVGVHEKVSPPTATRLVASLEEGGWVVREPDPSDRRIAWVEITDSGREMLAAVRENRTALLRRLLSQFDEDSRERLRDVVPLLEEMVADSS